jgi:hypothetical protein
MLGTPRSNNNNKRRFFAKVVAFCMELAQLEAIFRYFEKTLHKFFKNWTFDIEMTAPKCMKSKVFRHEKI